MIDHDRKLIFIHAPRTGGTSVEVALFGKDWWWIDSETKHITAEEARYKYYGKEWDEYHKFTVVRNSWDWMDSLYWSHHKKRTRDKPWKEWLQNPTLMPHEQPFSPITVMAEGVDTFLRLESLEPDLNKMLKKLGLDPVKVPHRQARQEKFRDDLRNRYDDDDIEQVRKLLLPDIERFNYSFPSRGLGDTISKITSKVGVKPCGGCKRRAKKLNKMVPYKKQSVEKEEN